ncbi:unnamed protein product [[Candida] boidinii]|uniref:Unnamed protein product n=1 Tax=Candida boidinii TaxID=5477 RepID=A0A9W6SUX7_CANBO|nr:hypothetical protein B5S30_g2450 [[Candida] boidinii]OWB85031.1 hypothetical protein B5S33_g3688 [[Candida] boidinii]GME66785.1 unnamed protein product [[Candida] boidinii]GMF97584.1 unnamed protein product [[Candida] boidinii]
MDDTEKKIKYLSIAFPQVDSSTLLEILLSCEGSLKQTENLLGDQLGNSFNDSKRRKFKGETSNEGVNNGYASHAYDLKRRKNEIFGTSALYQSSLSSLLKKKSRNDSEYQLKDEKEDDGYVSEESDHMSSENETFEIDSDDADCDEHVEQKIKPPKNVTYFDKEEIEKQVPYVQFHRSFLPANIADSLLEDLMKRKDACKTKKFYIGGKQCESKHKSAIYFSDLQKSSSQAAQSDSILYTNSTDLSFSQFTDSMTISKMMIEDAVHQYLSECKHQKENFEIREKWEADMVICNYYENNNNNLDWHSDKLTNIGPLPTIVSLSLGSTRIFRLRKIYPFKNNHNPIINIPLPHNTLLIMGPGVQEEYKHSVPAMVKKESLDLHPISGTERFNLTYRMFHPGITHRIPKCPKCSSAMILRRLYKSSRTRGRYFWLCSSSYSTSGVSNECKGFYYANLDQINEDYNNEDVKLYTESANKATSWVSKYDTAVLRKLKSNRKSSKIERTVNGGHTQSVTDPEPDPANT